MASLVHRFVFAALVLGLLALVDLLSFRKAFAILSLTGGVFGRNCHSARDADGLRFAILDRNVNEPCLD